MRRTYYSRNNGNRELLDVLPKLRGISTATVLCIAEIITYLKYRENTSGTNGGRLTDASIYGAMGVTADGVSVYGSEVIESAIRWLVKFSYIEVTELKEVKVLSKVDQFFAQDQD